MVSDWQPQLLTGNKSLTTGEKRERLSKEKLFLVHADIQRTQKTQIKVKAKQAVYENNNGIAEQKKRYNQERINVLNDGTVFILVGASEEI